MLKIALAKLKSQQIISFAGFLFVSILVAKTGGTIPTQASFQDVSQNILYILFGDLLIDLALQCACASNCIVVDGQ